MQNKSFNRPYRGKLFFPDQGIQSDVMLDPEQYLLHGIQELDPEGEEKWSMLCGEFEELGKVTFLDCFQVTCLDNRGRFTGAMQFAKLVAGRHLQTHADAFISSVTFSSDALNEWFMEDRQTLEDNYSIGTSEALPLVNVETGNLKIRVDCYTSPEPNVEIEIRFREPVNLYEFYAVRYQLQHLILFLTNEDPELGQLHCNGSELFVARTFQHFDPDWFTDSAGFSFAEITQQLETIFRHWFGKPKLHNIRDLVLERKYNIDLSRERYFLNMCVALESFHRRFINEKVPLADHSAVEKRELIKDYLNGDPELQHWFLAKSTHWKAPVLYDRLIDLKDDYHQIVQDLFGTPVEELIRAIKKCRDCLAHDGEYEKVFRDEIELFLVGYSLEMLLHVLLYQQHGITEDFLVQKLYARAHWNLKRLCNLNQYEGLSQ